MKFTAKNIFKYSIIFVLVVSTALIIVVKLPANSVMYECQQNSMILGSASDAVNSTTVPSQKFCQLGFHPEIKTSYSNFGNATAVGLILLAGFVILPAGAILLFRKIQAQPKSKKA